MTIKRFDIEHIGLIVENPLEMAKWYHDVLGFNIKFKAKDDEKSVAFVTDSSDKVMLELARVPNVKALTTRTDHHLQLHIAVKSDDMDQDIEYLVDNGAILIEKCPLSRPGDFLVVLYDPWGNCIQLVQRGNDIK
ncbi:VOC family protein [uncultured Methanolobus sp.]|uniref:VOC family protein n=1 Tax=uncultured Methanolobus sp. TaxID=218300 RepID=UPI002AAACB8E|nr:VOC family protein [uncultured Methanolobus sp.]